MQGQQEEDLPWIYERPLVDEEELRIFDRSARAITRFLSLTHSTYKQKLTQIFRRNVIFLM
jgi:hypothetical protein